MAVSKKPAASTKSSAAKPAAAKAKGDVKKLVSSTSLVKKAPTSAVVVTRPINSKDVTAPKKTTTKKTAVSVKATRTTGPRTTTATITKITRNIVGFYMTEVVENRRVTRSDGKSEEKLKAKYAELKTKIKSR